MASEDRFGLLDETNLKLLEDTMLKMEENYQTLWSKIQTVPSYMREGKNYVKYYVPEIISIGPIHHGDEKLKKGEDYKLMWASMYANEQAPQNLYRRITNNIDELRGSFSWDKLWHADGYNDEQLAWMLFVDGCAVLQILKKANPSKPEDLKVKVDILLLVLRDLFLLENQLPYKLLWLLGKDDARLKEEAKFKESMFCFCELQNMFTILESPQRLREEKDRTKNMIRDNKPTHLLDCLRTIILISDEVELSMPGHGGTTRDLNESEASNTSTFSDLTRIYIRR